MHIPHYYYLVLELIDRVHVFKLSKLFDGYINLDESSIFSMRIHNTLEHNPK